MIPDETQDDRSAMPGPAGDVASVAARMACWFWGISAAAAGVSLLVFSAVNRARPDGVSQSLLYRLFVQGWIVLKEYDAVRLPILDADPRLLTLYTNRDLDDAFLAGSVTGAFAFAVVAAMTGLGLAKGESWARRTVVLLTSTVVASLAAYAAWFAFLGATAAGLGWVAVAASLPATLGLTSSRRAGQPEGSGRPGRRNSLTRPALLLIISSHAILIAPALACAWVIGGILLRRIWLHFTS